MSQLTAFKVCPYCGHVWITPEEMVRDTELRLNGYQPHFAEPGTGLFHLTHLRSDCGTTVTVQVKHFRSYFEPLTNHPRKMNERGCPGYCRDPDNFEPCSLACDLKWIRDLMQMFKSHAMLPEYLPPK